MNHARLMLAAMLAIPAVCLTGCAERRLVINSEPAGATVWVNDVEVGRTPLEANFTHYGTYDVRLRLDGFEPIATSAEATAPWYEFIGADLVTEAIPTGVTTRVMWNFTLKPSLEQSADKAAFETDLLHRARDMKYLLAPPEPAAVPTAEPTAPAPASTEPAPAEPAPAPQPR